MNMGSGNGQLTVPPGFRFHPTDEELLYYYLRKKVSYEPIDLDVIREVDLNKLEPWDLKDKCRIGSGPQNEWYFFSHKDKKYPTGTRTNRATAAGFWKATGRDKGIHLSDSKRIGMRKTLVFYTGRAPHGHKTDWIMHEYRLDDNLDQIQEEGWVVCRVFKKKNTNRGGFQQEHGTNSNNNSNHNHQQLGITSSFGQLKPSTGSSAPLFLDHFHHHQQQQTLYHDHHDHHNNNTSTYAFDASMHLPQLFNSDEPPNSSSLGLNVVDVPLNPIDLECSHSLLRLTTSGPSLVPAPPHHHHRPLINGGDWTFLDKLLSASTNNNNNGSNLFHHHHHHDHDQAKSSSSDHVAAVSTQRLFPFQYLGCETTDMLKFSK